MPYRCANSQGEDGDVERVACREPEAGAVAAQRDRCGLCRFALRRGVACAVCSICSTKAHKKCTGRRRVGGGEDWTCLSCTEEDPPQAVETPEDRICPNQEEPAPSRNRHCPTCLGRLRRVPTPLICRGCGKEHHLKCARMQRHAMEMARDTGTWRCDGCVNRREKPVRSPSRAAGTTCKNTRNGQRMLQWNCDWLATKIDEQGELQKEKIDVAAVQETKMLPSDRDLHVDGFSLVRRDKPGQSEIESGRAGRCSEEGHRLLVHQAEELAGSGCGCPKPQRSAGQIPENCKHLCPPSRVDAAGHTARLLEDLRRLSRGKDVIWCGDFNAHHQSWDTNSGDYTLGEGLADLLVEESLSALNDEGVTWFVRREGCRGACAPDLTIKKASEAGRSTWKRLHRLSSDNLPILIEWRNPFKQQGQNLPQHAKGGLGHLCHSSAQTT